MARTATRRSKNSSLLPETAIPYLQNSAHRLIGFTVLLIAIFLAASLATYTTTDPSLNTASYTEVKNIAGKAGAYSADFLLQSLGISAAVLVTILGVWGSQYISGKPLQRGLLRLLAGIAAILLSSLAFAGLPKALFWQLDMLAGGMTGQMLLASLAGKLHLQTIIIGSALSAFFLLGYACQMPMHYYRIALQHLGKGVRTGFSFLVMAFQAIPLQTIKDALFPKPQIHSKQNRKPAKKTTKAETVSSKTPKQTVTRTAVIEEEKEKKSILSGITKKKKTPAAKAAENSMQRAAFEMPSINLLQQHKTRATSIDKKLLQQYAEDLNRVLEEFGVKGEIVDTKPGPVVTMYELEPAAGIKSSRVISLADDIARSMSAVSARVAVVAGRNVIGVELPNPQRETVYLRELIHHASYGDTKAKLPLTLGKDIGGEPVIADLAKMPHLLVAGTTGSGKSVAINTMILSLLYRLSPDQCKFIMVDPKMLELSIYDGIPHLLTPVVTDPKKAVVALKWAVKEMEQRYQAMSRLGVRNIDGYNQRILQARDKGEVLSRRVQTGYDAETGKPVFEDQPLPLEALPYIVVIVDEMADLMLVAGKEIEATIQRLAQMARAAGIHLIMATQRPSVDVITGTIKANFPTRISFQVTSKIDSRTILGEQGAEQLLGQGDMLFMAGGGRISRIHGPFVSDEEVESIVTHLKSQGEPCYVDDVTEEEETDTANPKESSGDAMYDEALSIILREGKVSTSFIQRHLSIGYNRAARIIDQMEAEGVVSKPNHTGKREILIQ